MDDKESIRNENSDTFPHIRTESNTTFITRTIPLNHQVTTRHTKPGGRFSFYSGVASNQNVATRLSRSITPCKASQIHRQSGILIQPPTLFNAVVFLAIYFQRNPLLTLINLPSYLKSTVQLRSTKMTESPLKNLFTPKSAQILNISLHSNTQEFISPISNPIFVFWAVSVYSHLTNKPILINRPTLLSPASPRRLRPHLLHILQYHIAMPIKRLDSRQQLPVVTAADQHLCVRAYCGLQDGEGPRSEFVFFELGDFELAVGVGLAR